MHDDGSPTFFFPGLSRTTTNTQSKNSRPRVTQKKTVSVRDQTSTRGKKRVPQVQKGPTRVDHLSRSECRYLAGPTIVKYTMNPQKPPK